MVSGFVTPWVVMALVLALHVLLPARWTPGYVRDPVTGERLRYRLNGLRVLFATLGLWALACRAGLLAWDHFYTHRVSGVAGACTAGLLFTLAIVRRAPPTGRGLVADLFFGRLENPQWGGGRVDAKMWLCLIGATLHEYKRRVPWKIIPGVY